MDVEEEFDQPTRKEEPLDHGPSAREGAVSAVEQSSQATSSHSL